MMIASNQEVRQAAQDRQRDGVYAEVPDPGMFGNFGQALGHVPAGIATRSIYFAGETGYRAQKFFAETFGDGLSAEEEDEYQRFKKTTLEVMGGVRPDPVRTGSASNIVYDLLGMGPEVVAAGSMPMVLGAPLLGFGTGKLTEDQAITEGVDPETAREMGVVAGATMAVGLAAPAAVGKTIVTKIASGAGINAALGGVQRGVTSGILRDNGYGDMADQYRVLDGWGFAADTIMGAGFGALHVPAIPKERVLKTAEHDAAMVLNDAVQAEIDAAPGIPVDPATRSAHMKALETAGRQLMNDEPVRVDLEGEFLKKPENTQARADIDEVLKEMGLTELIEEVRTMEAQARALRSADMDVVSAPREIAPASVAVPDEGEGAIIRDAEPPQQKSTDQEPKAGGQDLTSRIIAEKPDMDIPKAQNVRDEDVAVAASTQTEKAGETVKASEAEKTADEAVRDAENSGKIFDAAVDCFLRRGG